MANEGVELVIYPYDDYENPADILPGRQKPNALQEMKGIGGGSFEISRDDPRAKGNPLLLKGRNLCRVKVNGKTEGVFLLGDRESTIISAGERSERRYKIAGPGLKYLFDDARVEPVGGIKRLSSKERHFNFASEQGDWYSTTDWVNPVLIQRVVDGTPYPVPDKWPAAAGIAYWIWGAARVSGANPAGDNYFRYSISIATEGTYAIYTSADDAWVLYVDGEKLASADKPSHDTTSRVTIELSPGLHTIGYRVTNLWSTSPGGLANAVSRITDATAGAETFIGYSQTSGWKVLPYPVSGEPGWTPGEVLLDLMNEAEARGVQFPTMFTPTFTSTLDSNGTPWPASLKTAWKFAVGESMLSVITKLEEAGVDIWIDPENLELHMVPERGVDRTVFTFEGQVNTQSPVKFILGKHLLEASTQSKSKIKNNLLLGTTEGWFTAEDSTSVGIYGRIEATLNTGAGQKLSTDLANLVFAQRAQEEEGASYVLIPGKYKPYDDFDIGDWVLAPNERGESVKRRIMSIAVEENDSAQPQYTIEFDTIFRANEDRLNRIVEKLGGGGVGGGLANNAGSNPGVGEPEVVIPDLPDGPIQIPKAPTDLVVTSTGAWTPDGITPIAVVHLDWSDVTQDIDNNEFIPEYYEIRGILYEVVINEDESTTQTVVSATNFGQVTESHADLQPFSPDDLWGFEVRAIADDGTTGDWSSIVEHLVEAPVVALPAPSSPTLASSRGNLNVMWTGTLGDFEPPPQFRYIYAEVSPTAEGPWQRAGNVLFRDGRSIIIPNWAVGTEVWVQLTAVDGVGLTSAPSVPVSIIILGITGDDIEANSVSANVLIAGSVQTAHLSPDVGNQLDISANSTVQIIAGQASDAQAAAEGVVSDMETMQTYYSFGPTGAVISSPGSVFATAIRNDRIEMLENGNVVSYWNSGTLYVNQLVGERVTLGRHQIERFGDDDTVVKAL